MSMGPEGLVMELSAYSTAPKTWLQLARLTEENVDEPYPEQTDGAYSLFEGPAAVPRVHATGEG